MKNNPIAGRSASRGFTIIEVLIVLAIAGLILLIVFLAVPALQRNSRNNQSRNEAARLMAAAQEYVANTGNVPTAASSCSGTGGAVGNCDQPGAPNEAQRIWQLTRPKTITGFVIRAVGTTVNMSPASLNQAIFQSGAKCGAPAGSAYTITTTGVSGRGLVMVYPVENSTGGVIAQCLDA